MADVSTQKKYLDLDGLARLKAKADGRYVTALGTSGNSLTWTKNGAVNNITVPYASKSRALLSTVNGVNATTRPGGLKSLIPASAGMDYYSDIAASMEGMFDASNNSNAILSFKRHGSAFYTQMGLSSNGNVYTRVGDMTAETAWRKILDTGNFAPTLDERYVTRGTAQTITGAKTFSARARFNNVISAGESADDAYGFINVCRPATIDNAACFSWVRDGNRPFALGYNTSNQIVMGQGKNDKTLTPWMKLSDSMLEVKRLVSTVATGTAPLQVASTTRVANLNADLLDGVQLNGLLTGLSVGGVNKNTLSVTVGGVTKTATLTPAVSYGSRSISKTDNGGRPTVVLIADITALDSKSSGGTDYGFTGRATSLRTGGATNGCEQNIDIVCRASWSSSTARDLNTSNDERILPVAVTYQGKTYLALRLYGSGCDMVLTGWWRNCLETFTELLTPSGATVPEGVVLLDSGKGWSEYTAESAAKLRSARTLWGQTFNGEGNVSGNMTGVGTLTAGGEIRTAQGSSTAAFRAYTSSYGAMQRIDSTHYWFLLTNKDDPQGGFNSLRPLSIVLATGTVTLGNGALTALHGGNVGFGMSAPVYKVDVAGSVRASTGFICSRANSGSALLVAQNATYAMLQATNGYGNNYMAVTKTYGESGVFIQQQNGKYGYEWVYMKKTDIDAGENVTYSMLRLDEDGTISAGAYSDLGTERAERFMNVYRTLRLFRKAGVAVDVKCNDDNELEVNNAVSVKNKLTLRSASGKEVELTVSDSGALLVNGSPVTVSIKV